jgi:hypothetical protein
LLVLANKGGPKVKYVKYIPALALAMTLTGAAGSAQALYLSPNVDVTATGFNVVTQSSSFQQPGVPLGTTVQFLTGTVITINDTPVPGSPGTEWVTFDIQSGTPLAFNIAQAWNLTISGISVSGAPTLDQVVYGFGQAPGDLLDAVGTNNTTTTCPGGCSLLLNPVPNLINPAAAHVFSTAPAPGTPGITNLHLSFNIASPPNFQNFVFTGYGPSVNPNNIEEAFIGAELTAAPTGVPEPASMLVLGSGLLGLGFLRRRG